ncbi:MAG TPA: aminoacyl-tRNA hydrolase [Caulobacteraceae bacterium]|nr:aminoacyl-tRNA hydrolase [Caulobacteraceae bacterium]
MAMKQVIVVNGALDLPRGKMAAQVAHAAVGALLGAPHQNQALWLQQGMPKVVVQCASEDELQALLARAEAAGLPALLIRDAGRTVVEAGTATCVGIGPDLAERIDPITGALPLVR